MRTRTLAALAGAVATTALLSNPALAEPTPLVYEGRLSYLDVPIDSRADLRFRIFDAVTAGAQIGADIERHATKLTDGAFAVTLDVDSALDTAWLEVSVRAPAGEGDYVVLSPRQRLDTPNQRVRIASAPGAGTAANIDARASLSINPRGQHDPNDHTFDPDPSNQGGLSGFDNPDDGMIFSPQAEWIPNGANIYYNAGNVSIGTTVSNFPLTVRGDSTNLINARNTRGGGNTITGVAAGGGESRGVFGFATSSEGIGVFGLANSGVGPTTGMYGQVSSTGGKGVRGLATSSTGFSFGVEGQSDSTSGRGVFGYAPAATGSTIGVIGWSKSPSGHGVQGLNDTETGIGVFGNASSVTGANYAVRGRTASPSGWGGWFEGGRGVFIEASDILADSGDLFGTGGVLAIEATKSRIELLSDPDGTNGSNISLKEIDGSGAFSDGWNVYRTTQGSGSELRFSHSTLANNVGTTRMSILPTGEVGIGRTAAANELEVEGDASKTTATAWLANSDRRIKTDIETVGNALDTLDRVRLVSFDYDDDYRAAHPKIADHRYLNVIAQEFAGVFPEYVKGSGEFLPDGSEILQVDTYPLTIYSAAAVQELNTVVKDQECRIAELESKIESLSSRRGLSQSSFVWPLVALAGIGVLAVSRRKKESGNDNA